MTAEEAYTRLTGSCARKEMCKQDVYKWMLKFKIPKEEHDNIINKLVEENYIDELRFSCAFANDSLKYSKWGKTKIAYHLRTKQICDTHINKALEQLDKDLYEEIRNSLIEAKSKTLSEDDLQKEEKIKAYLYSRGF